MDFAQVQQILTKLLLIFTSTFRGYSFAQIPHYFLLFQFNRRMKFLDKFTIIYLVD